MTAAAPPITPRTVRCPRCGGPARYASDNDFRPFCSLRCREGDLGAWAAEDYRVAAQPPVEGDDDAPLVLPPTEPDDLPPR